MAAVLSENLKLVQMCLEELDTQEDIINIQEKVKSHNYQKLHAHMHVTIVLTRNLDGRQSILLV